MGLTLKYHLTMVPSVMVGESDGILTSVPGVDPPVGWELEDEEDWLGLAASDSLEAEVGADLATSRQSSPSSAIIAIRLPTWLRVNQNINGLSQKTYQLRVCST